MIAGAGGLVPELTWLYVAMAQFPVYLVPYLVKPVLARYREAAPRSGATGSGLEL